MNNNTVIPVFFACDERFIKYTCVALKSLIENASTEYTYHIHIIGNDVSDESKAKVHRLEKDHIKIFFDDVTASLKELNGKLIVRDYYSMTTYYRIFIPERFHQYDKVLYLDSDMIIEKDISELYFTDIGDCYVGAAPDQVVVQTDLFGEYTENVLGIDRNHYFNAGMLLINCSQFRKNNMLDKFIDLLNTYAFVVAQDQDYLNVLCSGKVHWLEQKWNSETSVKISDDEKDIAIIHYNLASKPWHYTDSPFADHFWKYAKETEDYDILIQNLENYSEEDRQKDIMSGENLFQLAVSEISNENNYLKTLQKDLPQSEGRRAVLEKIARYEKEGRFDEDVEDDPPTIELLPDEIDYLHRTWRERMNTLYAAHVGRWFMHFLIYKKQLNVKEIKGIENLNNLKSGAIITCNHFNALDSFIMQMVYDESKHRRKKLYRVIREGNYTNFPGFYGFLMRNCNTLPLSSNQSTMKKFIIAVNTRLKQGHLILFYPEQSLWWNYRKPKPLKDGAYRFAAKNNVPVIPCFVTMKDTDIMDADGFPVQEHTVHIGAPIYPDENKNLRENTAAMKEQNFELWKQIYEATYKIPLKYGN